jgi:hypothetical protein
VTVVVVGGGVAATVGVGAAVEGRTLSSGPGGTAAGGVGEAAADLGCGADDPGAPRFSTNIQPTARVTTKSTAAARMRSPTRAHVMRQL